MSKSISFYATYAILLLSAYSVSLVICDEEQTTIVRDSLNLTVPNPFGETPIFETNDSNGRLISIHLPYILDVTLHFRGSSWSETMFSTKILSGLLDFKVDRTLQGDQLNGPIKLSALGTTLYDNQAS